MSRHYQYDDLGIISVRMFGAKGDGVTDDTLAIQSAIDFVGNGGAILFPPGTYLSSKLSMKNNLTMLGYGGIAYGYTNLGVSIIKFNSDTDDALIDCNGTEGVHLEKLVLHGNSKGSSTFGVKLKGGRSVSIINCKILRFTGPGIGGDTSGVNRIINNIIGWNSTGIRFNYGIADNWIHGNQINANVSHGIYLAGGSNMTTVLNNRVEWNGGNGISIYQSNEIDMIGNQIDRNKKAGVRIVDSKQIKINSNRFKRNASEELTSNEKANLYLQSTNGFILSDNTFQKGANDDGLGIVSPDYGLVYFNCVDGIISNNMLKGSTVAGTLASEINQWSNTNCVANNNILSAT